MSRVGSSQLLLAFHSSIFIVVVYRHLGLSNLLFDMGITGVGVPAGRLPLSPIHDKCGDDKKIPRCVAPVTAMG